MTSQPTVLLGVTGGIAAYKAAELLRGFQKAGMDVRVMMTEAATRFVAPLTFETLSGHAVHVGDQLRADFTITHIEEGNAADIMVVAPATANTIGEDGEWGGGQPAERHLPGLRRHGGGGAIHEHQHVASSGHAEERRASSRAGGVHRRARRGRAGLRGLRVGPHGRPGQHRR